MMRKYFIILLILLLSFSHSVSARSYDSTESDIVTLEQVEDYLIAGGSRGEVIIVDNEGKNTKLQQYELRNQIIDVDLKGQMLYALSEYSYINVYNISDYRYTGQIQLAGNPDHFKMINSSTLVTATDNGSLVLRNLETDRIIQYPLYNNPFQSVNNVPELPHYKQYLGNSSAYSIPRCLCEVGDIEIEDNSLYVTYAGRLYTIALDTMTIKEVDDLTDDDTTLEIEVNDDTIVVAELYGNRLFRDDKEYSYPWTIEDIELASNGLIIATSETIRAELDGNWIEAAEKPELQIKQVELWKGSIYVAGIGPSDIIQIDDFKDTLIILPSWTGPAVLTLSVVLLIYLILSRISWINTYLILLNHRIAMRRGGFDTMDEYYQAIDQGFVDKKIQELVKRMGYDSYASFLHSMNAITSKEFISLQQARSGSYLKTDLEEIEPPEEIPDYVGTLFQKFADFIRVCSVLIGHLFLVVIQYIDLVILTAIFAVIVIVGFQIMPSFLLALAVYSSMLIATVYVIKSQFTSRYPRQILVAFGVLFLIANSFSLSPGLITTTLPGDQIRIHTSDSPDDDIASMISASEAGFITSTQQEFLLNSALLDVNSVNGSEVRLYGSGLVSMAGTNISLSPKGDIDTGFIFPNFILFSTSEGFEILDYDNAILDIIPNLPVEGGVCEGCSIVDHTYDQDQSRIISDLGYEYLLASNGSLSIDRDHRQGFIQSAQILGTSTLLQPTTTSIQIRLDGQLVRTISEEVAISSIFLQNDTYGYSLDDSTLHIWEPTLGKITLDLSLHSLSSISGVIVEGQDIWVVDSSAQIVKISLNRINGEIYYQLNADGLYLSTVAVLLISLVILSRSLYTTLRRKFQ